MAKILCAIYTRKSTEEGLEQDFNSLDAQREACAAFIASQKHEGWEALPAIYDDGGYSGGNANRPALQRLLEDIKAGKVNTIVVYKIDRLTRSLADFAKMVELFDKHNVTFVSVTQQFNTTTSMGRLTLNVLLSFAQFEREVTGERIRDKVAASKAKGMWMGGCVPLGYDVVERKLVINTEEAKLVRHIYDRYLALKSVHKLMDELRGEGKTTKSWVSSRGNTIGGIPFMSGPLYYILGNRIYLGEIVHKGKAHPGNHEPIITPELWERVQTLRKENRHEHRHRTRAQERSLLSGKLFDADGLIMSPTHSTKQGKRYRYYDNRAKMLGKISSPNTIKKVPATEIETAVGGAIKALLADEQRLSEMVNPLTLEQRQNIRNLLSDWNQRDTHVAIRDVIKRVTLERERVTCQLIPAGLCKLLGTTPESLTSDNPTIDIPIRLKRIQGGATMVIFPNASTKPVNVKILRAIAKGYIWNQLLVTGQVKSMKELVEVVGVNSRYISKLLPLAWLEPRLIENILEGREEESLQLATLLTSIK